MTRNVKNALLGGAFVVALGSLFTLKAVTAPAPEQLTTEDLAITILYHAECERLPAAITRKLKKEMEVIPGLDRMVTKITLEYLNQMEDSTCKSLKPIIERKWRGQ